VNLCERDERGWKIPHEGTKSRVVYEMICAGKSSRDIVRELSISKKYSGSNNEKWRREIFAAEAREIIHV